MNERNLIFCGVAASAATVILTELMNKNKEKKKKRVWVREWVKRREMYGVHSTLYRELKGDVVEFSRYLRMMSCDFDYILNLISPAISKQDTQMRSSIPASERLDVTLRFLANGGSYSNMQYSYRIPKQTLSKIIPEVLDALWNSMKSYINTPKSAEEWEYVAKQFEEKWNMPNCIGAIDGKHVLIKAPKGSGSFYYNNKSFHSIVLMAVVDADYQFIFLDVGKNGRISDDGVFLRTSLYSRLEENSLQLPGPRALSPNGNAIPYFLVGDDTFPLKTYLMKPYPGSNMNAHTSIFNYRLSRARRIVENSFGILANRFRILMAPIHLGPEKADKIVTVCCALHNFLRSRPSRQIYNPNDIVDSESNTFQVRPGSWRSEEPVNQMLPIMRQNGYNVASLNAKLIRDELCHYVNNLGSVPWQHQMIST